MVWFTKFTTFFTTQKSAESVPIGVAEDDFHYCIAYFEASEPIVNFYPKSTALSDILSALPISLTAKKQIIRPVPYHYIWRKYLLQPQTHDPEAIFRQVVQTLKQELPIAIEEVYFDYQATQMSPQNMTQIILYALRKRFAGPLLLNIDTILDCELHCWQRGLHYFLNEAPQKGQVYAFKEKFFAFKVNELAITLDTNEPYLSLKDLNLPDNILSPELYILAIGAMLWQREAMLWKKEAMLWQPEDEKNR